MAEFDNNMRGALFRQDEDKRKSEKSPEFSGSCEIDGQKFWIAAWVKTSKAGKKFFSLSFTAAEQQSDANPKPAPKKPEPTAVDDEIPF
jgi:hypothetical protein